VREKGVKV